jgi:hypothetical protein
MVSQKIWDSTQRVPTRFLWGRHPINVNGIDMLIAPAAYLRLTYNRTAAFRIAGS